jgi:hypothetical protein
MNTQALHSTRLFSLLLLAVTGFAQSGTSINGSYAFLATAKQSDSFGDSGGAILSILNFDGAGNISGTAVLKVRTGEPQNGDTGTGAVQGTYTSNSDGTGNVALDFTDFGFSAKLAMVVTNGGKTIQFADGPGSTGPISFNSNLQGTPDSVSGPVPGGFFLQSFFPGLVQASGTIPFTLNRTYNNNGIAIYSLPAPATGTGPVTCPDGTSGNWSITIFATTAIMKNATGDFMMPVQTSACGGRLQSRSNYTGLANLNVAPNGISIVLHLTGYFIVGSGQATNGGAPKGAYGLQLIGEPFPQANVEVMSFDGAGVATATAFGAVANTAFTGTYTNNPDGTGVITLAQNGNTTAQPATFAYALADDASTIYLLRTSGGAGGANVLSGIGHLQ